ncbi:hypothetical protein ODJ79_27140 [Actinoplanes sp. KI2]|uniref:hypothetical protein n=1 Tax=Actinoplanes sp. KI2 TaxID=2983315 RepID=UPI0021D6122C|nr:hypothetical protein [Actinoplanes sp. KI2]MCU7727424.1 hypothetical protein [Actinoplanes sp. KI2]
MSLTGLPLILLTGFLVLAAGAATVRFWRLPGRKRLPFRIAGLVAIEVLLVAEIGLVVNRQECFYPSWRVLGGAENAVVAPAPPAGRLDGELDADGTIAWSPPEAAAWHLAAAPLLVTASEYGAHADRAFPVVLALTSGPGVPETRRRAAAATGLVTLILQPTPGTTAPSLADLSELLRRDARVGDGLVLLADPRWTSLAAAWPGHPPVVAGHAPADFDSAVRALPPSLAAPQRLPS